MTESDKSIRIVVKDMKLEKYLYMKIRILYSHGVQLRIARLYSSVLSLNYMIDIIWLGPVFYQWLRSVSQWDKAQNGVRSGIARYHNKIRTQDNSLQISWCLFKHNILGFSVHPCCPSETGKIIGFCLQAVRIHRESKDFQTASVRL